MLLFRKLTCLFTFGNNQSHLLRVTSSPVRILTASRNRPTFHSNLCNVLLKQQASKVFGGKCHKIITRLLKVCHHLEICRHIIFLVSKDTSNWVLGSMDHAVPNTLDLKVLNIWHKLTSKCFKVLSSQLFKRHTMLTNDQSNLIFSHLHHRAPHTLFHNHTT